MKAIFSGCQPGGNLFFLMTVCLVVIQLERVKSDHTTLCINLPKLRYKDGSLKSLGMEKFPQNKTLWKWFQEKILAGRITDDPEQRVALPAQTHFPQGGLRIYRIKDTSTGLYLNGWFRIEFTMKTSNANPDLDAALKVLILHVDDDYSRRQSIGEFSYRFPSDNNNCPQNDASEYMIISCGGASRAEPLVSNTIVYVRNNSLRDVPNGIEYPPESNGLRIVPDLKGRHTLNFYIRIPVQDCNQHRHFVFRARMLFDKTAFNPADFVHQLKDDIFRVDAVSLAINLGAYGGAVPGASDALPSRSHSKFLNCSEKLSIAPPLGNTLPWYQAANAHGAPSFEENQGVGRYNPGYVHACQGDLFTGRCNNNIYTLVLAHGTSLVQLNNQNVAGENQIPLCDVQIKLSSVNTPNVFIGQSVLNFYQKPQKYNNVETHFNHTHDYLHMHAAACNATYNGDPSCTITKVVTDVKRRRLLQMRGRSIHLQRRRLRLLGFDEYHPYHFECAIEGTDNRTKYTGNNCTAKIDDVTGLAFHTEGFPRLIWGLRKGHALLMAIAFLFVLPVNLFVTRYFKESFMSKRVLYSRIWYQVHVHGTFLLAVLMIASLGIVYISEFYLGSSLTHGAIAHRVLGWITFTLFIVLTVLGGFRCYEDPLRMVSIGVHWGLGLLFYFLMVIEMSTAVLIPGNGVASNDPSMCEYDLLADKCAIRKPEYVSGAFLHIFVWLFVEVIMHIIMMFFIFVSDKQMAVEKRRIFFPVLIPVIKEHSKANAFGQSIRVILLCVYLFLALCSTSMYIIAYITHTYPVLKGLGPMEATHSKLENGTFIISETLGDF